MTGIDDMDVVELRAAAESASEGAQVFADKMAERILEEPTDLALVAWASSYNDLRKLQRAYRQRLKLEVAG